MAPPMPPVAPPVNPVPAVQEPASAPASGYTICINCLADGTFSVRKGPLMPEGPAPTGGMPMAGNAEDAVSDFPSALRAAAEIYKANPMGETEQSGFERGYPKPKPEMEEPRMEREFED